MARESESARGLKVDPSTSGPVREELSQAKARLGVCVFALLYMAGWTYFSGPIGRTVVWAVGGYAVFSAIWLVLVRLRPGEVAWRRVTVIFGDLGINTFFMHALQAKGAFFYPIYLWIIVGNGVRFGPRYLMLAMAVGVAYFGPMLVWSPYWRANTVAGSGLLAGMVVLPMFYLSLIRNLHQVNARLREEVERSQAAVRAKTDFLANMSHELRTPMTGVIGIAEVMQKTSLTATQKRYLGLIQSSAGSLLAIIDDVLELSRIEESKVVLRPVPLNLEVIVGDVLNLLRPGAEEKGLEIQVTHPAASAPPMLGDPLRIRQILINLVANSIKFTDRGRIEVAYRLADRSDGRVEVCFDIADTGIGIPREKLEKIFGKFEQVEATSGRRFGGSGLGLSISRHLARLMEGDVEVSSALGKGSTFTATLLLEPCQEQPATALSDESAERRFDMKALVVEDNPVNQLVTTGFLENLGLTVVAVSDGETALERAGAQSFDVIFMDVRLPGIDGLETTRRIRAGETGRRVPIVALTANAFAEDREACLEAGMNLHLRKPMRLENLKAAIETLGERGLLAP